MANVDTTTLLGHRHRNENEVSGWPAPDYGATTADKIVPLLEASNSAFRYINTVSFTLNKGYLMAAGGKSQLDVLLSLFSYS